MLTIRLARGWKQRDACDKHESATKSHDLKSINLLSLSNSYRLLAIRRARDYLSVVPTYLLLTTHSSQLAFITMWKSSVRLSSLADASLFQGGRCLTCQLRNVNRLQPSLRYYATSKSKTGDDVKPATASKPTTTDKFQFKQNDSPSAPQPGDADFIPPALDRPIGTVIPPQEGQNTGIDERSLQQRRDDFVNYDKHIERRKELYEAPSTIYSMLTMPLSTEQGKSQNHTSENGPTCAITRVKPSNQTPDCSNETKPSTSLTCTASRLRRRNNRKTPPQFSAAKCPLSMSSPVSGRSRRLRHLRVQSRTPVYGRR